MIRLTASNLHILMDKFICHPLPLDVAVPEPLLLRCFHAFMGRLDACELEDVQPRYRRALDAELLLMVTYDLAEDLFLTCWSIFVEQPIVDLFRNTVAADKPPPSLGCVDDSRGRPSSLRYSIVELPCGTLPRALSCHTEQTTGERSFVANEDT